MRAAWMLMVSLIVVGCSSASQPSASIATDPPPAASPTARAPTSVPSVGSASPVAITSPIVGEWVRTASCDEALAAFVEAGLNDQIPAWVVGNYVPEGATAVTGDECANASPAVPHSHFFTADGRFGSRDEHGQDVDDGAYKVVDADTLSFPSEEGVDVLVDFAITGDEVTFTVAMPSSCEAACRGAYAWALSAFFGPRSFERK